MILERIKYALFLSILLGLSSCLKEEIAISKMKQGDFLSNTVEMGNNYGTQIYFSLKDNKVVASNNKVAWDLAFESDGNHVILNAGKGMAAHKSTDKFENILSASDVVWDWDVHTGNLDSTAFGEISGDNSIVYIIDRAYNDIGVHLGYFKVQVLSVSPSEISIAYGDIAAIEPKKHTIVRSKTEQFTYFSLENLTVKIAPENDKYDLVFTQYIHLFKDPIQAYLVTGVILNRTNTAAARLDEIPFHQIERKDVEGLTYSSAINAIGYGWKDYNLDEGVFTTYPKMQFIIQTQTGMYYKLRFIGFYSDKGLKGSPSFEFQLL